jgi:TRAP-type transport system periplasmic protein
MRTMWRIACPSVLAIGLAVVGLLATNLAPAEAGSPIIIKVATETASPEGLLNKVSNQFKAEVEKAAGGRVRVEVYMGTVGTGKEITEALVLGSNQLVVGEKALLVPYVPSMGVLSLPYVFKDQAHIRKTLRDSQVGKTLEQRTAGKGITILGWWAWSPRALALAKKPVKQLADMAGLKVRVQNDPVNIATYQAMKASPVPIAWPEVYLAMSQGTVDSVDTTVPDGRDSKLPEVSKYLSLVNSSHSISTLSTNKAWFDALPPDLQKIVSDAARTAARFADADEPTLFEAALSDWAKRCEILRPDLTPFRQAVSKIYPQYYNTLGKDLIDAVIKLGE